MQSGCQHGHSGTGTATPLPAVASAIGASKLSYRPITIKHHDHSARTVTCVTEAPQQSHRPSQGWAGKIMSATASLCHGMPYRHKWPFLGALNGHF